MKERFFKQGKWILLVGILFLAYRELMTYIYGATCPSVIATGMPCPGCGLTRACLLLLSGHIAESVDMNPMWMPVMVYLLIIIIWPIWKGRAFPHAIAIACILIVIGTIIFGIRFRLYFPERVPYVYTGGSMLEHLIPGYREGIRKLLCG